MKEIPWNTSAPHHFHTDIHSQLTAHPPLHKGVSHIKGTGRILFFFNFIPIINLIILTHARRIYLWTCPLSYVYWLHCHSFFELINHPFAVHAHVHHNGFRCEKLLCVILHWQCCIVQNCTLYMHDRTSIWYSGIVLHQVTMMNNNTHAFSWKLLFTAVLQFFCNAGWISVT